MKDKKETKTQTQTQTKTPFAKSAFRTSRAIHPKP